MSSARQCFQFLTGIRRIPKGFCNKARVARNELPWVIVVKRFINPNGVASCLVPAEATTPLGLLPLKPHFPG